ncbi:translocation/assembly module TamB domain-containing protein [Hyphobacterium sp. HN65]|uniref:Translocation/assembly module TamB domain-containing protein n=1 Tax=Hyphobacterium lacteum TaxID=3116575 RepID=A0ABU7LQQ9_9PROT|nr:translocation/assembly module TamB domain-containing protein [Hyphobacterium sp. HN65]MEE2525659.1 translocation/assembly module TamB domain-containing protein [Hyphobacterium sp. HN65]
MIFAARPLLRLWLIRIGIGCGATLLALLLFLWAATGPLGRWAVMSLADGRSLPRGLVLDIEGLSGNVLARPRLDRLILTDQDGEFITIENLAIDWDGLAILAGRIDIDELTADRVGIARQPVLAASDGGGGGLPRIRIGSINIAEIALDEPVLGAAASISLAGEARLLTGVVFRVEALRTDIEGDYLTASARWDEAGDISGSADLFISGESPIAGLLRLNGLDARVTGQLRGRPETGNIIAALTLGQYEPAEITGQWNDGRWTAGIAIDGRQIPENYTLPFDATSQALLAGQISPLSLASARIDGGDWSAGLIPVSNGLFDANLSLSPAFLSLFTGSNISLGRLNWRGQIDRRAGLTADGVVELGSSEIAGTRINGMGGGVTLTRRDGANALFADLTASGLALPPASPLPSLPWLGLSLEARQQGNTVSLTGLTISSDLVNAQGELDLGTASQELAGALAIEMSDVSAISEIVSGPVQAEVDITSLSASGARLRANLDGAGLSWQDATLENLLTAARLSGQIETDFNSWQVRDLRLRSTGVLVNGNVSGEAASFTAGLDAAVSGDIALETVQIGGGAAIALQLTSENGTMNGMGVISTPRLAVSGQEFTDPRLGIDFTLLADRQQAEWQAESGTRFGPLVATGNFDRHSGGMVLEVVSGQLGQRAFTGDVAVEPERLTANLTGEDWALGDGNVSRLAVHAIQEDGAWQFTAEAGGGLRHDFTLSATAALAEGQLSAEFDGLWNETIIRTREPLTYSLSGDTPGLLARLRVGTGRANIRWTAEDQFRVRLEDLPADLFVSAFPLPELSGMIAADVTFRDRQGQWSGEVSATATDLHITQFAQAAPVTIEVAGSLDGSLDLQLRLTGDDLAGSAHLVRAGRISDLGQLREDAPISGSISMNGAIEPVLTLVLPDTRHLAGHLSADLAVSGSVFQPRLRGATRLENGRYLSEELGVSIDAITAAATFDYGRLRLDSFSARDQRGGTLAGRGEARLGESGWQAETHLEFSDFNAVRRPDLSVIASGGAEITLGGDGISITGEAELERIDARPPDASAASFAEIEVTEINRPDGRNGHQRSRIPVSLDYRINAPGNIFISGEPFSTEWRGSWHVRGSPTDLDITGDANLISGRAFLLNRAFRMEEGRVTLSGSPRSAEIDLLAVHTRDNLTVNARLTGPATSPSLTLSSDPALPQDEILARLLFDQNASQLSPMQTATIAAQLSGQNLFGIIGSLRRAAGLDRLDFDTTSDGQLIATAGQQLTEDVYLELESRGTSLSSARLEWTLTPDFTLLSRLTGDTDASIALRWRTEFD